MAPSVDIRSERGQTLVELLVVMFMMGLLVAGITSIFVSSMQTQSNLTLQFEAVENLHVGIDRLRQDVNLACSTTATSGTAVSTITFSDPPCDGTNNVTWCTSGSGTHYALYRYTTGSTCSNGEKFADFFTSGAIFTYYKQNVNAGSYSLAYVHLNVTVNAQPSTSNTGYTETDDLAFRNGVRQ